MKKPDSQKSPSTLHTYFKETNNYRNAPAEKQEIGSHINTVVIDDDLAILEDKSTKVPQHTTHTTRDEDVKIKSRKKKQGDKSVEKSVKGRKKPKQADR